MVVGIGTTVLPGGRVAENDSVVVAENRPPPTPTPPQYIAKSCQFSVRRLSDAEHSLGRLVQCIRTVPGSALCHPRPMYTLLSPCEAAEEVGGREDKFQPAQQQQVSSTALTVVYSTTVDAMDCVREHPSSQRESAFSLKSPR